MHLLDGDETFHGPIERQKTTLGLQSGLGGI